MLIFGFFKLLLKINLLANQIAIYLLVFNMLNDSNRIDKIELIYFADDLHRSYALHWILFPEDLFVVINIVSNGDLILPLCDLLLI